MRQSVLRIGIPLLILLAAAARAGTEDGSCIPPWELLNYQTQSPTNGQAVKSSSYGDLPTVVMLLYGG